MKNQNIAVLLSTYNGANFLEPQLLSLLNQTVPFDLYIRDDGSADNTLNILKKYTQRFESGSINIESGGNIGVIRSFESLINTIRNKNYAWIAFCDQDDIWHSQKLEIAISKLKNLQSKFDSSLPLLYHSDLNLIDSAGNSIGKTFWERMHLHPKPGNKLNRIICQPMITGCSMVVNKTLLDSIKYFPKEAKMHDWWFALYAICKGKIVSDFTSLIGYRQHNNNVIGSTGFHYERIRKTLFNWTNYVHEWKKENRERLNQADSFLREFRLELNSDQIDILEKFVSTRNKNFLMRKLIQFRYGFFQQSAYRLLSSILLF